MTPGKNCTASFVVGQRVGVAVLAEVDHGDAAVLLQGQRGVILRILNNDTLPEARCLRVRFDAPVQLPHSPTRRADYDFRINELLCECIECGEAHCAPTDTCACACANGHT